MTYRPTTVYQIQTVTAQALREAGDAEPDWATYEPQMGVDYTSYASVSDAADSLAMDGDGCYAYRIVEVTSPEDSYGELEAENLDALDALDAWVNAGCPRRGEELQAVERAALARVNAAPVKVVPVKKIEAA